MRVFLCEKPSQGRTSPVLGAGQRVQRLLQRHGCRRDLVHRPSGRSGSARGYDERSSAGPSSNCPSFPSAGVSSPRRRPPRNSRSSSSSSARHPSW